MNSSESKKRQRIDNINFQNEEFDLSDIESDIEDNYSSDIQQIDELSWPDSPVYFSVPTINSLQNEILNKIFDYCSIFDTAWALPFVCKKWQNICKTMNIKKLIINGGHLYHMDEYSYESQRRRYDWTKIMRMFKSIELFEINCLKNEKDYSYNYFDENEQTDMLVKILKYIFQHPSIKISKIDISKMVVVRNDELLKILDLMKKKLEQGKQRYDIKYEGMFFIHDFNNDLSND
tara:strand:+ start:378 stop:1079 length:702 start_codon:yes stop_codon:yes gene_type:complete